MKKALLILAAVLLYFIDSAIASGFPAKEIYTKCSPSVVVIKASRDGKGGSIGTGSILTEDGRVITNAHVVIDKDEGKPYPKIGIYLKTENILTPSTSELKKIHNAEVVQYDMSLDLAVLKISGFDTAVKPIEFSDPAQITPGEEVIAIGHPEQGGFWTLTYGRISGEKRDFQSVAGKDVFQTDTSVNRGNSGGPLLDRRGYMVAVNSNIARLSADGMPITGINFAIKSSVVKKWLEGLGYRIAYGRKPLIDETTVAKANEEPNNNAMQMKEEKTLDEVEDKTINKEKVSKFETPKQPYDYEDFLKAAEQDLENMMEEMRRKIKR